jgi:hypothetical protein
MYTGGDPLRTTWVVVFTLTYCAYCANQRTPDSRGGRQLTRREVLCAPFTPERIEIALEL